MVGTRLPGLASVAVSGLVIVSRDLPSALMPISHSTDAPSPALHVVSIGVAIPALAFVAYRMMFAVITPALATGAVAALQKSAAAVVERAARGTSSGAGEWRAARGGSGAVKLACCRIAALVAAARNEHTPVDECDDTGAAASLG